MDTIQLPVIIAQIINFLILFFIFKKLIGDRLNRLIEHKKLTLEKLANAEREYQIMIEKTYGEKDEILNSARNDANRLLLDMEDIAYNKRQEMLDRAEKKAELIIAWGKKEIEKERLEMMAQMKDTVVGLALMLNKKLFKQESVDKDFMEKELEEILSRK